MMPPSLSSDVTTLRAFVETSVERIMARHRYHSDGVYVTGSEIVQEHTELADTVIRRLHTSAIHQGVISDEASLTLIALGGYGRAELNPHSDLDVLILHAPERCPRKSLEEFSSLLITALWDIGFEVGHAVRTIRDCKQSAYADVDARTAMLEGRYITGSRRLWAEYESEIQNRAMRRGVRGFIDEKVHDWRTTMGDPSATVYVLEPDIKLGIGGLREVHTARWVARARFGIWDMRELVSHGVLPEPAFDAFGDALDFVWRVRNELHYLAKRRSDVLTFAMQEHVAKALGYVDEEDRLAEERLMRDFFRHIQWLHECARIIIMQSRWEWSSWRRLVDRVQSRRIAPGVIELRQRVRLERGALGRCTSREAADALLLSLLNHRSERGLPLSVGTRQQIVDAFTVPVEPTEPAVTGWLRLLAKRDHVGETLRDMHHLGVLGWLMPEFEKLRALVRYDYYHRFTVDEHSLLAIENLDTSVVAPLHHGRSLSEVLEELTDAQRVALRISLLLHDIGKGVDGEGGHVERGWALVESAVGRLAQLSETQRDDIRFLVREHLTMSHTAQRRNLDDPETIQRFVDVVQTPERLRMLYLMTYADIRAVNPELWTDWTATLVQRLYNRAMRLYRGELHLDPNEAHVVLARVKKQMGPDWHGSLESHFAAMGLERMAFFTPAEIEAQVRAVSELSHGSCVIKMFECSHNYSSIVFAARDRHGLFADIAGVLASDRVSILSADLNTRQDGIAVDTLHVADGATGLSIDEDRVKHLEERLIAVDAGELDIEALLASHARRRSKPQHRTVPIETVVRANNEDSRDYTIIDVRTHDRVGLLYRIAHALSELGLDISLAKISTEAFRAVDVFYVTDADRKRVRDANRLQEIVDAVTDALSD